MTARGVDGDPGRNVGRPLLRREDRPLLTGEASFVADLPPTTALHVRFARSPLAHGRIVNVDTRRARELPGVRGVFTAADLALPPLQAPIQNPEASTPPRPLLAEDVVRFAGEPVAVVVAEDAYRAEDAGELIELELEPLPALVDARDACAEDALQLHEDCRNVLFETAFDNGDVEAAFATAAVTIEREFRHPRLAAAPLESRCVLAVPERDGVVLWASSQAPHRLATVVSELLGLSAGLVRVICPDIGGGFGQKAHAYPEEIVTAWLALELKRPMRWVEDRLENLMASSHARDQRVRVRAATDSGGRLLAVEADVLCDQGAYPVFPHGAILEALGTPAMIPGPYRLPSYRFRARSVATNKAPEGAYRGVGLPVSAFVHERLMDILAGELSLDPAEIRRRNLVPAGDMPYVSVTGQRYDSGDYAGALEAALSAIDYQGFPERQRAARDEGLLLGLGLSCYVEYTGINSRAFHSRGMVGIAGHDAAHLRLTTEGEAQVWTTLPGIGQGSDTAFSQLVADQLGLSPGSVRIERPDTSVGGLSGTGTFASRSAVSGGGALAGASDVLRKRLLDDAAEQLEIDPGDLRLENGRIGVTGDPSRYVDIGELVAASPDPERYRSSAVYDPPGATYPYATHACEVQVDADIGALTILRYVIVEDCGTVINPLIVEGQVHGATAQGIAGVLLEELAYTDDGQLATASLIDYLIPTASELPVFEVDHLAIPAPDTPLGAKGVGEGGTLAPPGALANGVSNALGREFNRLPLRPEMLREAGKEAGASTAS